MLEFFDVNNVEEILKFIVKIGDIWIVYMLKKGIMLEVFIKRIKIKKKLNMLKLWIKY